MEPRAILFPGWGVPPALYGRLLAKLCVEAEVVDFGFFGRPARSFRETLDDVLSRDYSRHLIIGHSMGAHIALECASRGAGAGSMILFSPFARFCQKDGFPGRDRASVQGMIDGLDRRPEAVLRGFWRSMCSPNRLEVSAPGEPSAGNLAEGLRFLMDCDCSDAVPSARARTLCLHGSSDMIVSAEMVGRVVSLLPRVQYYEFHSEGHALPFEGEGARREAKFFLDGGAG